MVLYVCVFWVGIGTHKSFSGDGYGKKKGRKRKKKERKTRLPKEKDKQSIERRVAISSLTQQTGRIIRVTDMPLVGQSKAADLADGRIRYHTPL